MRDQAQICVDLGSPPEKLDTTEKSPIVENPHTSSSSPLSLTMFSVFDNVAPTVTAVEKEDGDVS